MILWIIIFCILSAIFYRAGGMSKDPTAKPSWIPKFMRKSWVRDAGCSLLLIGLTMILFGVSRNWWCYLASFGLSWAGLSTYWDELFGFDNFFFSGFVCGLAGIPLIWCGVPLSITVIRIVVCAAGWGLLHLITDTDYLDEMGRGALFIV
jgi:hypothetical protein